MANSNIATSLIFFARDQSVENDSAVAIGAADAVSARADAAPADGA